MSGRGQHLQLEGAEGQYIAAGHIAIGRLQQRRRVREMHGGWRLGCGLHRLLCARVPRMRMGERDPADGQPAQLVEDFRCIVARVDDNRFLCVGAGHHVAIGVLFADMDFLDGQPGHIDRLATLLAMADARQVVKYTFVKVDPQALAWPAEARQAAAREFTALLDARADSGTLLTYSTVGLRGDCDLLIWQAADRVDEIQRAESQWRGTQLGPHLTVAHSFLAMMRPSPYLGRHKHPDQEGRRTRLKPAGGRYLFVYPMVKKRVWYRLPYERRKAMMVEHFAIGHRYPQVKINTAYPFGLDHPAFVLALECDEAAAFLDLVMELRESQASRYTEREPPSFPCVLIPPADALQLALGLSAPESAETDDLQRQVSLISGGGGRSRPAKP